MEAVAHFSIFYLLPYIAEHYSRRLQSALDGITRVLAAAWPSAAGIWSVLAAVALPCLPWSDFARR